LKVKVTERSALVRVAASTQQLTSHAGLVLVRELAGRLGVHELLDRVTVKKRQRGYSPAQAILGLCETLIAGGECLDDIAVLRGDSAQALLRGHGLPDPPTLGRFLRRFSLGHLGQLNRALDEVFTRVHPLLDRQTVTLDLDATYIEHHGPVGSRQGTRGTYKGKVCWHPLLCFVGETGEWLHAKLRNGHAAASTGASRFLDECLRRLPEGVLRADEGFWGQDLFADLERRAITYAVGAPLIASVRGRISEIAEADWQPSCYRDGSEVASFRWQPKSWKCERRFIVRRDPVEAGEQLSLEGREWHYWVIVTERRRALSRRARVLAPRQGQPRKPDQGGQAQPRPRQPPLHELPRQLGLPALHAARLQPALLVEAARSARARTQQLRKASPLPFHRRRGHRRPLRTNARLAPFRWLPAPRRLHRNAATHPRPRTRTRLNLPLDSATDTTTPRGRSHPAFDNRDVDGDPSPPSRTVTHSREHQNQSNLRTMHDLSRLPQDPGS